MYKGIDRPTGQFLYFLLLFLRAIFSLSFRRAACLARRRKGEGGLFDGESRSPIAQSLMYYLTTGNFVRRLSAARRADEYEQEHFETWSNIVVDSSAMSSVFANRRRDVANVN